MPGRAWFWVGVFAVASFLAWAADVRVGAGAALQAARHPGYEEPLDPAPLLFVTADMEVSSDASGLAIDIAAGRAGDWIDWQASFGFVHTFSVDMGIFAPFVLVGAGWTGRSSGQSGELSHAALFPEAGLGVEAALGALTARVLVCYRPAPLPVPLVEADEFPLRRVAVAVRFLWGLAGRSTP
jgi:hypothetical protein